VPDLSFDDLKSKQRAIRDGFEQDMGLRAHRAISWIGRAEMEAGDADARFIFLWIAFNSAYADESDAGGRSFGTAREDFESFFARLIHLDADHRIYNAIWTRFSGPIRLLMQNRYLFSPFWSHQNGIAGHEDWETRFQNSSRFFGDAVTRRDTTAVLTCVFDRLYVLRNQIMHGGATWNGSVNRGQVTDGAEILSFLLPVFVDLMMDNPAEGWGRPYYPVVDDGRAIAQGRK